MAADAPARRARPLRRGHRGLRLPGDEPARARPREHGAAPRRRQPRHVPRRAVRPGDEVDRAARVRGAEGALAAGDGAARRDRRVRADRARPRLGLGRAGDDRAPRRRRLGARRRQALDRQRLDRRRGRRLGAPTRTARSRASSSRRRTPGFDADARSAARARRARSGRPTSRSTACASARRPAARREHVQGHRPRAGHHARHVRLGRARPRRRRLRRRADLQQAAHPVRQAAGLVPDRPGPAREDARRGHGHAALLHAARAPRGRGPAHRHDRRPGEAQQHAQGARR